jgi:1-acyl-sn-glycerol-3-phosphate acyltransferase
MIRIFFKLNLLALVIGCLLVHHFCLNLFVRHKTKRLKILSESVGFYSRLVNRILGVKIDSDLKLEQTRGHLILSNHMSYLDIMVLSSVYPTLYVTSVEMKETFFLGQVCSLCACLFTERRRGKRSLETMKKDIAEIGELLGLGFSTTIFPEGTSTNGLEMLPFKTTLLESAIQTQKKVLPVAIRYTYLDGEVFSEKNCDNVCWYGDDHFVAHLLRLVKLKEVRVKIMVSHGLSPLEFKDRTTIGRLANQKISDLYSHMKKEHC